MELQTKTVTINGIEFEIQFECSPEQKQTRLQKGWPAELIIYSIKYDDKEIEDFIFKFDLLEEFENAIKEQ